MFSIKHNFPRAALFGALVSALSFAAGPAAAAIFYLDGGAGHLFLTSGEAVYRDVQNDNGGTSLTRIMDGRQIKLAAGVNGSRTWVIHIPLGDTNQNWNVQARGTTGSGTTGQNGHRICSFNSNGTFFNCGSQVAIGSTSTIFVPLDGTAFSQTTLTNVCSGSCSVTSGLLSSIKANN